MGYKNSRVFIHEITRLIIMKMNMKNRSHRCKINRPRYIHGYKCSKSKKSLGIKCQFYKMVKHTQIIRRQIADELFDCV